MAYGAVPDDVEIQKLTRAQQDALSRHNIHENVNTFLANENTPLLIGGAALLALTPLLLDLVRKTLADAGTLIPDVQWEKVKSAALLGAGGQWIVDQLQKRKDSGNSVYAETREKYGI
jgi:hypothetical protein